MIKNDPRNFDKNKEKIFDQIYSNILDVVIYHISYIFLLNEHYMSSSDYIDFLECGMTPEEGSQYYVAPYIKKFFINIIKVNRNDIAELIIKNTNMDLL